MGKYDYLSKGGAHTREDLTRLQALPLEQKINLSERRIAAFYERLAGKVYISFSGGKDSTVLLHLVRSMYPDVKAVFSNTGLEFPEIVDFVQKFDNVEIIKPRKTFKQVLEKYGYPLPSKEVAQRLYHVKHYRPDSIIVRRALGLIPGKFAIPERWKFLMNAPFEVSHKCCDALKKLPFSAYHYKHKMYPYLGFMAHESYLRQTDWMRRGCNIFDSKRPSSRPIMFWTENDIQEYIKKYNIEIAPPYAMGYDRTGCVFCMFGHFSEPAGDTRFHKLSKTHPQLYSYCMDKLGLRSIIDWTNTQLGRDPDDYRLP